MRQADELVVLVDATKFAAQSSMILAPLNRATCIVTDHRITASDRRMVEDAGVELVIADAKEAGQHSSPSTA